MVACSCDWNFMAFSERVVKGDGNCQFRALSDQLFRDGGANHEEVRSSVIERLLSSPDDYAPYCAPMSIENHAQRMSKPGEWGDHITLQAASDAYGVEINVLTSYMQAGFIEIQPRDADAVRNSPRNLWISFFQGGALQLHSSRTDDDDDDDDMNVAADDERVCKNSFSRSVIKYQSCARAISKKFSLRGDGDSSA